MTRVQRSRPPCFAVRTASSARDAKTAHLPSAKGLILTFLRDLIPPISFTTPMRISDTSQMVAKASLEEGSNLLNYYPRQSSKKIWRKGTRPKLMEQALRCARILFLYREVITKSQNDLKIPMIG